MRFKVVLLQFGSNESSHWWTWELSPLSTVLLKNHFSISNCFAFLALHPTPEGTYISTFYSFFSCQLRHILSCQKAPCLLQTAFSTYWIHKIGKKITSNHCTPCKKKINYSTYNELCILFSISYDVHDICTQSCMHHFMLLWLAFLFLYPRSKPPTLEQIRVKPWISWESVWETMNSFVFLCAFFHLTVSGPRRCIALPVVYRVTVVPRHTPHSSHLVAMATGHCTLEDKITHRHRSPVNESYLKLYLSMSRLISQTGPQVKVQLSRAWVSL